MPKSKEEKTPLFADDEFEKGKPAHGSDNDEALKVLEQEAKEEENA